MMFLNKQGEEPKSYDHFEETFPSMCQLKRENGVWWLGTGEHRRRDDEDEGVNNENAPAENLEENPEDFEWEADEVEEPADVIVQVPEVPAPVSSQQKETTTAGVNPSRPTGSLPYSDFLKHQAELDRIRAKRLQAELDHARAENARLLALL
ncbi:hypothetical protein Dimus_003274 [Dionaea muscipula]